MNTRPPGNQIKSSITVNSVSGNKILATVLESSNNKKGRAVTIITTSSTIYKPDPGVVAAGKTIFVFGTVNSDGSITAQVLGLYDATSSRFGGVITSIDGSTITVRAKDGSTHTILLTARTTFILINPSSKTQNKQAALQSDLKVGVTIEAQGTLDKDGSLTARNVSTECAHYERYVL